MKSVEKYPEFQSDSKNIQFLTRKEHLEAHDVTAMLSCHFSDTIFCPTFLKSCYAKLSQLFFSDEAQSLSEELKKPPFQVVLPGYPRLEGNFIV